MKKLSKGIYFLVFLFCLFSQTGHTQEQFEKRFSLSFDHQALKKVIGALAGTQTDMGYKIGNDSIWEIPVTMDLTNVSLDEALDKVLALQTFYKDYMVTDYGNGRTLELMQEKSAYRYYNHHKTTGRYYHIGDQLPDSLYSITNYHDKIFKLSGIKKKLIILDLWGVNCAGCIAAMPRMQELQEKFRDQIQVILVTKDNQQKVDLLKKHVREVRETTLPIVTGENMLGFLFDYIYVPRQVWIDGSGTVRYITNKDIGREKYIKEFLDGQRMKLYETKDTIVGTEYDVPLSVSLQPINQGDFGLSAYLAPHKEDKYCFNLYADGSKEEDTEKGNRFERMDMYNLYKVAYNVKEPGAFSNTRIIKNYDNPHKYDASEILGTNFYDYELITKKKDISLAQFYNLMRGQMDAFFGVKSTMSRLKRSCYVLKRMGRNNSWLTKGGTADLVHLDDTIMAKNIQLAFLVQTVNIQRQDKLQLVDETGYDPKSKVDWIININFEDDLPAVQKALAAYGLSLTKEERVLDCIILDKM
jgi:thiol-disulfide isomerase/thioredoxin